MRKLVFVFGMLVAMTFASCGNSTKCGDAENDSTAVDSVEVVDTVVADSVPVDTVQL